MKKTFIITTAIAFGVTAALIVASITVMATGMVKRNIFGGYTFAFESSSNSKSTSDYDKKRAIIKGLKTSNVSLVNTDDSRIKKLIFEISNPNEDLVDALASFNVIFYKDGKVVKIVDAVESIEIKANEKIKIIMDLIMKEDIVFDALELIPQG